MSKKSKYNQYYQPLSDKDFTELENFLSANSSSDDDEAMTISMLDGYLTAVVIGPKPLSFNDWFPPIWGEEMKQFASDADAERILELTVRLMNSIIDILSEDADEFVPLFDSYDHDETGKEYIIGSAWVMGFIKGMHLCFEDWEPLFEDDSINQAIIPLTMLVADGLTDEQAELLDTPEKLQAISDMIPNAIVEIYHYWQPCREAAIEQGLASITVQREGAKIGRNDVCPCGSGKKYKKCCG